MSGGADGIQRSRSFCCEELWNETWPMVNPAVVFPGVRLHTLFTMPMFATSTQEHAEGIGLGPQTVWKSTGLPEGSKALFLTPGSATRRNLCLPWRTTARGRSRYRLLFDARDLKNTDMRRHEYPHQRPVDGESPHAVYLGLNLAPRPRHPCPRCAL